MTGDFAALVQQVLARLRPPPRVVTPEQYRALACNRCGQCCDDIPAPQAPDELAALVASPAVDADRRRFMAGLIPVGPRPDGWRYRCRYFRRDVDGLGVCLIYDRRPAVCSRFPYGEVVREWPACAWYVEVRDPEGRPLPQPERTPDAIAPGWIPIEIVARSNDHERAVPVQHHGGLLCRAPGCLPSRPPAR